MTSPMTMCSTQSQTQSFTDRKLFAFIFAGSANAWLGAREWLRGKNWWCSIRSRYRPFPWSDLAQIYMSGWKHHWHTDIIYMFDEILTRPWILKNLIHEREYNAVTDCMVGVPHLAGVPWYRALTKLRVASNSRAVPSANLSCQYAYRMNKIENC